jgi:hypothetical protein
MWLSGADHTKPQYGSHKTSVEITQNLSHPHTKPQYGSHKISVSLCYRPHRTSVEIFLASRSANQTEDP